MKSLSALNPRNVLRNRPATATPALPSLPAAYNLAQHSSTSLPSTSTATATTPALPSCHARQGPRSSHPFVNSMLPLRPNLSAADLSKLSPLPPNHPYALALNSSTQSVHIRRGLTPSPGLPSSASSSSLISMPDYRGGSQGYLDRYSPTNKARGVGPIVHSGSQDSLMPGLRPPGMDHIREGSRGAVPGGGLPAPRRGVRQRPSTADPRMGARI